MARRTMRLAPLMSFRKQGGMTRVKSEKTDRNAPCPCGSGKKYKKCCLGRGRPSAVKQLLRRLSEKVNARRAVD